VRFRGTHDRIALILAFGFARSGMIETIGYFRLTSLLRSGHYALAHAPRGWMVGRKLLAVLQLAALAVEQFLPTSPQPSRETAGVLLGGFRRFDHERGISSGTGRVVGERGSFFSRPWEVLPGALWSRPCFSIAVSRSSAKAITTHRYMTIRCFLWPFSVRHAI
jgi:hypothetical protein